MAFKGLGHVIFCRVVVESHIRPRWNVPQGNHLQIAYDRVWLAAVVQESPKVTIENFLRAMSVARVNMQIFTDL